MKQFIKYSVLALVAALTLQSCDVDQFVEDNFEDKSLVIISPNFLKNRVTVIFEDAATGQILEDDINVSLITNKKTIDLTGHYQNTFAVTNGMLNFALDPNEITGEEMDIFTIIDVPGYRLVEDFYKITKDKQVLRVVLNKSDTENIPSGRRSYSKKGFSQNNNGFNRDFDFSYDGDRVVPYLSIFFNDDTNFQETKGFVYEDDSLWDSKTHDFMLFLEDLPTYLGVGKWESYINLTNLTTKSIDIALLKNTFLPYNDIDYEIEVHMVYDGVYNYYRIKKDGSYKLVKAYMNGVSSSNTTSRINNYQNRFTLQEGTHLFKVVLSADYKDNTANCVGGMNLNFEGLAENESPSFMYKVERNNEFISVISSASPTVDNPVVNTAENFGDNAHLMGVRSNKITFLDHPQYHIEPQEMELGGADACGKNYTFKVYPKAELTKYRINLQLKCADEEFSIVPSVAAFYNAVDTPEAIDIMNLENGSATLYLKPDGKYKVQGEFDGADFSFTFTNSEALLASVTQETITDNDIIDDITYTFTSTNGVTNINATITLGDGYCPE